MATSEPTLSTILGVTLSVDTLTTTLAEGGRALGRRGGRVYTHPRVTALTLGAHHTTRATLVRVRGEIKAEPITVRVIRWTTRVTLGVSTADEAEENTDY